MTTMDDAIVIGAGMAGASAARALADAGRRVTVVEGRDRIGGRIYSVRDFCALPVEGGAEFIHGVGAEHWPAARAAGLSFWPSTMTRGAAFDLGHGARWLPLTLLHPGVWRTFPILYWLRTYRGPDLSAHQFIDLHHLRGRARIMAEMTLTAHLPGSVDEVGVHGLVADRVLDLETGLNHRVAEGYDALPGFLARGLDVAHGFDVARIEWSAAGVRVVSRDGRERAARAAVCTLPVGVLKSERVEFVPALPARKRAALQRIVMGPVVKILLRFRTPFWPRWLSTLACGVGPVTLYWNVFHAVRDGPPPVLVAYATGPRAARLSAMSEAEAARIAIDDLARLNRRADPHALLESYRRIDWSSDPFALGGYTFLLPGGVGAREELAAADTGALFWAGAATATGTIADSVQAAYVSGQRAAAEVDRLLRSGRGTAG